MAQEKTSRFNIMSSFIKSNLKLILRLVSTDIHNTEVSLTANEFNSLRVAFRLNVKAKNLASLTNFYKPGAVSAKVHMNELSDWILDNLTLEEPSTEALLDKKTGKTETISYLNKAVMVKDATNMEVGK